LNARTIPVASGAMQCFSMPAGLAAVVDATAWARAFFQAQGETSWLETIGWFAALQLFKIVYCWIASKIVAHEAKSSFINAVKLWGFCLLVVAVLSLPLIVLLQFPSAGVIAFVLLLLLIFAVIIGLPMKIYNIGILRSLGFLLITTVLSAGTELAVVQFLPHSALAQRFALRYEKRKQGLDKIVQRTFDPRRVRASSADHVIAADPKKPIIERQAALQRIHRDLETRRANLKAGDQAALDAYNRDDAHYRQLLDHVRAPAAAGT
jgi:hypothetical protein